MPFRFSVHIAALCRRVVLLLAIAGGTTAGFAQHLVFNHLNVDNGLSQNSVLCMAQDKKGFIWLGTRSGLNRYNSHDFTIYKPASGNSHSISNPYILSLLADSKGRLWAGTVSGLNLYNAGKNNFERMVNTADKNSISHNTVTCLYEDRQGRIWAGTSNGLNLFTGQPPFVFTRFFASGKPDGLAGNEIRSIYQDGSGDIWVGTTTGLTRITEQAGRFTFKSYYHTDAPGSLGDDFITTIAGDNNHTIWIGTQHKGINRFEPATQTFTRFEHDNNKGPAHNTIRKIVADNTGKLWIGTLEGLSIYTPGDNRFTSYQHDPGNQQSLSQNSIYSIMQDAVGSVWIGTYYAGVSIAYSHTTPFTLYRSSGQPGSISSNIISGLAEDAKHNLWIGTEGGGLNYFNRQTGSFISYKNDPQNAGSISSNLVKTVTLDANGNVWAGTHLGGLNLLTPSSTQFAHFRHNAADSSSIASDDVISLVTDSHNRLWIGTDRNGLDLFNREQQRFVHYTAQAPAPYTICGNMIKTIFEDSRHNIWVGTGAGICVLRNNASSFQSYFRKEGNNQRLQSDYINCITEDSQGQVWVGTYVGGLSRFNEQQQSFETFTEKDGLPSNNIIGIVPDSSGLLWLSTDNGLSRFDSKTHSCKNYNIDDGIAGNEFNNNAFFKDKAGELFFGSINGLTSFFPSNISLNNDVPPVVFTGLRLFNQPVAIDGKDQLLHQAIDYTPGITFTHDQNIFTLEFALLNYIKPYKNRYAYQLEGFEKDWNYVSTNSATYTNLAPGDYTLLVKAANNDGIWTSRYARMQIHVLPPVWRTWWAWCVYVLLASLILSAFIRFFWIRAKLRQEHALHQLKLNFFTNISHEIRTHLTLIMGPVEKLLHSRKADAPLQQQLEQVSSNSRRLLRLVTELMDFRKADTRHLQLHLQPYDMPVFLQQVLETFSELAASRHIQLTFNTTETALPVLFDQEQMEKVFFNLLSNAFKFTPDGGCIAVAIQQVQQTVHITVTDNGRGIAPQHLHRLFDNYFQVNDHGIQNTGYGIGLALAKNIVELHKGQLTVQSKPAVAGEPGSTCFTVVLPMQHQPATGADTVEHALAMQQPAITATATHASAATALPGPAILLVEDNNEVLQFLQATLSSQYRILTAANGYDGWQSATEHIPDLIISDVMMSGMDGLTLCRQLKTDERTSHIPVILLTAKNTTADQLSGLETGADYYISKPFSITALELQVRNLLASREKMRQQFSRTWVLQPDQLPAPVVNDAFTNKIIDIIEAHMGDEDFGVPLLAAKVAMSIPVLYKKLKAVTDLSVNDFIKSIRLKKAAELLLSRQYNVNEAAFAVGYNDRKHFSQEFKKQFGSTPSEYLKKQTAG